MDVDVDVDKDVDKDVDNDDVKFRMEMGDLVGRPSAFSPKKGMWRRTLFAKGHR